MPGRKTRMLWALVLPKKRGGVRIGASAINDIALTRRVEYVWRRSRYRDVDGRAIVKRRIGRFEPLQMAIGKQEVTAS